MLFLNTPRLQNKFLTEWKKGNILIAEGEVMQKFILKMETEAKELDDRIIKNKRVLLTQPFGTDEMGMHLLDKQVQAMKVYLDVLEQRIRYEGGK